MNKKNSCELPPIALDPAHAQVVRACQNLRQDELEHFFKRVTGSHVTSLFLREVLYWFMPNKREPDRPRCTVHRDDRYWMCRSREEWMKKHGLTRRQLESAYKRCADFLDVDHFMFASQRRTHYSLRFEKLRDLMEHDPVLRDQMCSDVPVTDQAIGAVVARPVGTEPSLPYSVNSVGGVFPKITDTQTCGRRGPSSIAPAVQSADHGGLEKEVEDELAALPTPRVKAILKAAEGSSREDKLTRLREFSGKTQKMLGYLLLWQSAFETDYEGRQHFFNEEHIEKARELASQGVRLRDFSDALKAAWEIRGISESNDPFFMCRNHSRKFGLFCKHFARMEDELVQGGLL